MKYAVFFYMPPQAFADRVGPHMEAFWGPFHAYHQALVAASVIKAGQALGEPAAGKTIAVRDGKQLVQDGPYADTKEQLAGFMLIEAAHLDEAIEWAARCPAADRGSVEVRPLMAIPDDGGRAETPATSPETTHVALLYGDEKAEAAMSPQELEEMMGGYFAYTRALREAGATAGGEPLEPTTAATTVRLRDGKRLVQDGPYADTKEQLGGYYLLSCASDREALDWAAQCPAASTGHVEVRPVLQRS